ncbi:MAG: M56 family metallopeptidase, partial [Bacteroidia bacterium]|nr:M56 family metallopeptidase [Bacteroidia bacterium]
MTELILEYALGNTLLAMPLAVLAWTIGRWRRYPSLAHALWVLVMIRLVMPPIAVVPWLSVRVPLERLTAEARDGQRDEGPGSMPSAPENGSTSGAVPSAELACAPGRTDGSVSRPEGAMPPDSTALSERGGSATAAASAVAEVLVAPASAGAQQAASRNTEVRGGSSLALDPWLLVGALWLVGTMLIVGVSAVRVVRFRRGLRVHCSPAGHEIRDVASRVAAELGVRRRFKLLSARSNSVPFVWGSFGGPIVVLPAALAAEADAPSLRLILMHELAHIRRRDDLVRWLDWAVVAWLWWNPLAWVARRGLRLTEELACDAVVLRTCGVSTREYGACLVAAAESLAGSAFRTPAQACTMGDGGSLEQRITIIMSGSLQRRPSTSLRVIAVGLAAACLMSGLQTVAGAQSPPNPPARGRSFFDGRGKPNIVDTAVAAKFQTLVAAAEAAGLAELLRSEGPFTVFAPSDEAFAALPAGTLESLLLPENKEKLRGILAHHVVPGRLLSMEVGNIEDPQMARTAAGDRETISADRRGFRFGAAEVVRPDILCGNGVIHAIDRVVLPKPSRSEESMGMGMKEAAPADLLDALRKVPDGRYSTFIAAVEASGREQDWAQSAPDRSWTVF